MQEMTATGDGCPGSSAIHGSIEPMARQDPSVVGTYKAPTDVPRVEYRGRGQPGLSPIGRSLKSSAIGGLYRQPSRLGRGKNWRVCLSHGLTMDR